MVFLFQFNNYFKVVNAHNYIFQQEKYIFQVFAATSIFYLLQLPHIVECNEL